MAPVTQTCVKCQKQFLVIDPEQQFLREKGIPLPVNCPQCRQDRRLALRGGRKLYRTKCQVCGKDIVVSYDPDKAESTILCREDWEKYTVEHEFIITDPLPGDSTPVAATATPMEDPVSQSIAAPAPTPIPEQPVQTPPTPTPPAPAPTPEAPVPQMPIQTPPAAQSAPVFQQPVTQQPSQNLFQSSPTPQPAAPASGEQPTNDPISQWANQQPNNPQEPQQ